MVSVAMRLVLVAAVLAQGLNAATVPKRATTSSTSSVGSSQTPLPPSQDPWYTAPDGFERAAPGTILRIRSAPGNLTSISANCSGTWNILYRTTDSLYKPTWAVTTVFVPAHPVAALLSYQPYYDSVDINASPSYAMYGGVGVEVNDSLSRGWYVNVPDFEGPLASFTAGVMSGHATLDSVRAALTLAPANTTYAMWGYSGGALASEWAAELQVQYAPELNFSGAALGGLTPNTTSVLQSINKSYAAGLAPPGILGLVNQYPAIYQWVVSQLKSSGPDNATTFLSAENMTLSQTESEYAFQNISSYFVNGLDALLNNVTVSKVVNSDGQMGYHGVPQMPLFVYKAIHDLISPINDTDALVSKYCGIGANILYERNEVGGHAAEATNGYAAATAWLESVLSGTYASRYSTQGCTIKDVTVNITDSAFKKRADSAFQKRWMLGSLSPDQSK